MLYASYEYLFHRIIITDKYHLFDISLMYLDI